MSLQADRHKYYCIYPSFEGSELSAQQLLPEIHRGKQEYNWEDMGCGADEWLSYNWCAIEMD
jgi:hypothetical protein